MACWVRRTTSFRSPRVHLALIQATTRLCRRTCPIWIWMAICLNPFRSTCPASIDSLTTHRPATPAMAARLLWTWARTRPVIVTRTVCPTASRSPPGSPSIATATECRMIATLQTGPLKIAMKTWCLTRAKMTATATVFPMRWISHPANRSIAQRTAYQTSVSRIAMETGLPTVATLLRG